MHDEEAKLFADATKIDLAAAVEHLRDWRCHIADHYRQKYADLIEAQARLIAWLLQRKDAAMSELCDDCPPFGYPTDKTRCLPCPRRTPRGLDAIAAMPAPNCDEWEIKWQRECMQKVAAQAEVARLREVWDKIGTRLNNHLCEMKPGYDDSITGFNEAWDIMQSVFDDALRASEEQKP